MDKPIRREGEGFVVDVAPRTVELIEGLCDEMETLLGTDSPLLERLFPPPYGDDVERNEGYAALAGPELIDQRVEALRTVREVLRTKRVGEDQMLAWMRSINDMRPVLGTMLGVTDDEDPAPTEANEQAFGVYEFLGVLLEFTVSALSDDP